MDKTFIGLFIFSIILIENVHSEIIRNCPPLKKKICKSNKQIMCIDLPEDGVGCGDLFCKPKKYNIKVGNKNIKCNNKCDYECGEAHIQCDGGTDSKVPMSNTYQIIQK